MLSGGNCAQQWIASFYLPAALEHEMLGSLEKTSLYILTLHDVAHMESHRSHLYWIKSLKEIHFEVLEWAF